VHNFTKRKKELTLKVGNVGTTLQIIHKNGAWTRNEDMFLTANFLCREIHVYLEEYPDGEC
jgi:hypothetical protein